MSKSVGTASHNIMAKSKSALHWRDYYEMTKPKVVMLL
ncbi:MAG: heme o synthase, partial [Paraglaciecola chathamensis]